MSAMDLTIEYTDQPSQITRTNVSKSPALSAPQVPNCFASLPTEIAQSLSNLRPFSALVILRLHPNNSNGNHKDLQVAWTGGTLDTNDSIGLHSRFAQINDLSNGEHVRVSVTTRIVDKPYPSIKSATLRPIIYDTDPRNLAAATNVFSQLSAAAVNLESALLARVRVLSPRLSLPLSLPGGVSLDVRVVEIVAQNDNEQITDPEYAILQTDAQVVIESPPPPPRGIKTFLRVLSLNHRMCERIGTLWRTHAFVSVEDLKSMREGCALVSHKFRQSLSNEHVRLIGVPVSFQSHRAVPLGHVLLPPSIWAYLRLTPLTSVLFEEVAMFPRGPPSLRVTPVLHRNLGKIPTINELKQAEAAYYEGMILRDYKIVSEIRQKPSSPKSTENRDDLFPWDSVLLQADEADDIKIGDGPFWDTSRTSRDEQLKLSSKSRVPLSGLKSFPQQETKLVPHLEDHYEDQSSIVLDEVYHPLADQQICKTVKSSVIPSNLHALHSIMSIAKGIFSSSKGKIKGGNYAKSIFLEGPIGCGKSHLCTAVAAILRTVARIRTVWIRCDAHSAEKYKITAKRIRMAFQAAVDGGPGLIVLDNIDSITASVTNSLAGEKEISGSQLGKIRRMLSEEIINRLTETYENQLMVLMNCKKVSELEEVLRVPGVVHSVLSISLPSKEERAAVHFTDVEGLVEKYCEDRFDKHELLTKAVELSCQTEGYCARDFVNCKLTSIAHPMVGLKPNEKLPSSVLIQAYENAVRELIPVSRLGIKVTKSDENDRLTWSRIGGLNSVKKGLKDALELPSKHPQVFANIPIRLPHGILLYGPPGCGKTLIARTAAVECGMRCIMVKGPELMSKYIGESEAETRRAFERAAQSKPCVLLFDEFDSLAPQRGGNTTGVSDRVVNTLLTCMDGAERLTEGVYVIATTSRPEVIDPALLRPGRLDRWIAVDIPKTAAERMEILEAVSLQYFNLTKPVCEALKHIAEVTDGYTGADLGGIANDASLEMEKRESHYNDESPDEEIVAVLKEAVKASKPSMPQSRRDYFQSIMARFAPNAKSDRDSTPTNDEFGRRVALK